MAKAHAYRPRIYFLHPLLAGPLSTWPLQLEQCARMGFDHVLLPAPFAPGRSGNLYLTGEHARLHPALGFAGTAEQGLAQIARYCEQAGLKLLLDVVVDQVATDSYLAASHPHWFASANDTDPADPRHALADQGAATLRLDDGRVAEEALGWWSERLRDWADSGVAGFSLQAPHRWPRAFADALLAQARTQPGDLRLLAAHWQLPADDHAASLDFDAIVAPPLSTGRDEPHWLEQQQALRRVAPAILSSEEPFGERLAHRVRREDWIARASQQAASLSASLGSGWLMPMGFEWGLREPLNLRGGSAEHYDFLRQHPACDLSAEISAINAQLLRQPDTGAGELRELGSPGASVSTLLCLPRNDQTDDALVLLANRDLERSALFIPSDALGHGAGELTALTALDDEGASELRLDQPLHLEGGELRLFRARRRKPVLAPALTRSKRVLEQAIRAPRVAVEDIQPAIDGGEFVVKRTVGESLRVEADAYMDGHDQVAVALLWRAADETQWRRTRMRFIGNDRWAAEFPLERLGRYVYTVEAWRDAWGSYHHEIEKKHAAHLSLNSELLEGRQLVEQALHAALAAERSVVASGPLAPAPSPVNDGAAAAAGALQDLLRRYDAAPDEATRVALFLAESTTVAMEAADTRAFASRAETLYPVDAEREGARYASWYEIFPRSMSGDGVRHGTFDDVIAQLPRVRSMGFDVLYFPPIHPIGRKHRKGPNNTLTPGPTDPGSPYAIGAAEGGHTAVHPDLGTLDDFRRLRSAAHEHGLELALDFAIQCAPDHPWLKEHPDWFAWRADGTIKYAENPPKKYEDIVNVDFYAKLDDGGVPELWLALRDAVLFWCNEGVRLFRVDNPHTKPLPFWRWLIADVRGRHPDAVFLAEAFTRPKVMKRLAKIGYSQSYTYFTWRNTKAELTEYLTELTQTEMREYFRPHFFVNTPDINPLFLQTSGRAGFVSRAVLAATLSGLWGVYSGFELCEAAAMPGKEEYLDSEKYQLRAWDWNRPGHITREITLLNRLRRENPALQTHMGVSFYDAYNDNILYYGKATPRRDNVLLIAVNLDPHNAQEANFEIPLWEFGLPDHGSLAVEDLVSGQRFTWTGKQQWMRLTPDAPFAIWRVQPA